MNWGKRLDMGKCCLHFQELGDLELISVAKVIVMSTPKEYLAYYKRKRTRLARGTSAVRRAMN